MLTVPTSLNIANMAKMRNQNYYGDETPDDIKLVTSQNEKD